MGSKKNNLVSRRGFLASTSSAALLAGLAWPAIASVYAPSQRTAAPAGSKVAKVRIYPAIGICRVGGSDKWFYAPEIPGLAPDAPDGFKDGLEKIKKQVQRFRVYAFDDQDRVIGEITDSDSSKITWNAHLANTKAAWYGFNNPLDNGEDAPGLPGQKRNQYFVTDAQREEMLIIDGGVIEVEGRNVNWNGEDPNLHFSGKFWGTEDVGLGELRTDDMGRLLVVPPDGVSNSPTNAAITSFSDNDGWHDDWCDGPVRASVELGDGRTMQAEPAWVACVGPNFAPEIPPITTLYDLVMDLNVAEGWSAKPEGPISFMKYVYPTLRRVALMEWVTTAANLRRGWLAIGDMSNPEYIARLADPSGDSQELRQEIFNLFRNPYNLTDDSFKEERLKIPYMMGDGVNYDGSPLQWFQFPKLQYDLLKMWADGNFTNDYDGQATSVPTAQVRSFEEIPLQDQPDALTEAALEPCSGGAFHPGVELTYYLRLKEMYARNSDPSAEPFRLAHGDRPSLIQNVGRLLTPEKAFEGYGPTPPPIGGQMAGDLTRWMGLPWQCDAFSCQQVLLQQNYPTAVWWPALLPIDVLPEAYYNAGMNEDFTTEERAKFFDSRLAWSRGVAGIGYHANSSYWDGITNMITVWERMGFVVKRPGPVDADRPRGAKTEMFVEVGHADNMETRFKWRPEDGMLPN